MLVAVRASAPVLGALGFLGCALAAVPYTKETI